MRLEIHVVQPKTLFESVDPFEIVHQALQEISANRDAFGSRTLQLRQIVAQLHDAVEVVHAAIRSHIVGR